MKATANHPDYRPSRITGACGMVFETFSTRGDFAVDVCSNCHPFYTGKQKLLDSAGRVERFNKKYGRGPSQGQGSALVRADAVTEVSARRPDVGGQAVIEGVMMRSPASFTVVCRRPDGSIVIKEEAWRPVWSGLRFLRWPCLRGAVVLLESLINGI